jgi:hypothetical protein
MALEAISAHPKLTVRWYGRLLSHMTSWKQEITMTRHFSRVPLALIPEATVLGVTDMLLECVTYWRERAQRVAEDRGACSDAVSAMQVPIYALSALSTRQSAADAGRLFRLALELGADPALNHHFLFDGLTALLKHSALTLGSCSDGPTVLDAIEFPLAVEVSTNAVGQWPQPLDCLNLAAPLDPPPSHDRWVRRVDQLIAAVAANPNGRQEAAARLAALSVAGLLSPEQSTDFGAALWSHAAGTSAVLPTGTRFYEHVFVDLPSPSGVDPASAVKARLFLEPLRLPEHVDRLEQMRRAGQRPKRDLIPGPDNAVLLLDELLAHEPQAWMVEEKVLFASTTVSHHRAVGEVISHLLVPALEPSALTLRRGQRLLALCATGGLASALPGLVHFAEHFEELRGPTEDQIYTSILGISWEDVAYAAEAVAEWARSTSLQAHTSSTSRLVDALISVIQLNREVGLVDALAHAKDVLAAGGMSTTQRDRLQRAIRMVFDLSDYKTIDPLSLRAVSISLVRRGCVRVAQALMLADPGLASVDSRDIVKSAAVDPLPEVRGELLK